MDGTEDVRRQGRGRDGRNTGAGRGDRAALRRARRRRHRHRRAQRRSAARRWRPTSRSEGARRISSPADLAELAPAARRSCRRPRRRSAASTCWSTPPPSPTAARSSTPPPSCSTGCSRSMSARPSSSCRTRRGSCSASGIGARWSTSFRCRRHGGQPFIIAYSARRAALATLTQNAAFSLMRNRIRVNGLNIGWMDTPGEHAHPEARTTTRRPTGCEGRGQQPFGRLLKPHEVARAVAFLASDESRA